MESDRESHIGRLFSAELQFRLATAVRHATTLQVQPLDVPTMWTHGQHSVGYEEIILRQEQADYAAWLLSQSATYLMAVAVKDAIRAVVPDPKSSSDSGVRAAYQVSRMIRNAFAHAPFSPVWSIDQDCRDRIFAIPGLISLDTTGRHGTALDWRHYGGPLALLRLCKFVRLEILDHKPESRTNIPPQIHKSYQQGNLLMTEVDEAPAGAVAIEAEPRTDSGIVVDSD